ncbi:MAG: type II secretion system F family protein [Bacillota bacterium]|nr:type II secretion system F family protein [Bacillota bacterium]
MELLIAWLVGLAALFLGVGAASRAASPPLPRLAEELEALRGDVARMRLAEAAASKQARPEGTGVGWLGGGRDLARRIVRGAEGIAAEHLDLLVPEETVRKLRWSGTGMRPETFGALRLVASGAIAAALGLGSTLMSSQLFALVPMALVGAGIGWIAPDLWLTAALSARRARIERELPSYIDLLVTCTRAGMPLEAAVARVERETAGELARVFGRAVRSVEVGQTTADALSMAADDVGLDDVEMLATTVARAQEYGAPFSAALAEMATTLRAERRSKMQERASRMGTVIMIPLVVFILPVTLLFIGYPAVSTLLSGIFGGGL